METKIIDGRKIRDEILESIKKDVAALSFRPVFCDVLVGGDKVSAQYVGMKKKTALSVGFDFHDAQFPDSITTDELIEEIKRINKIPNICGIIVQLPLPVHIDKDRVVNAIDERFDVDCLSSAAARNFYDDRNDISYPAAFACVYILNYLGIKFEEKNTVVIGQGELVGKPVAHLLRRRSNSVTTVTRSTIGKNDLIKNADIIISATGDGKFLDGSMIKEGSVVIDAGTSESMGGIVGDVDSGSVVGVASHLSPVPGGVGPITIALLFKNILYVAQKLR